jgi:hypothetical protein
MHKELRESFAGECRYAVTKMQEATPAAKKLFYFSVFFSEAQRLLNLEWDNNISLINIVTLQTHTQINVALQNPAIGQVLPIDWEKVFDRLTIVSTDLTAYLEKSQDEDNPEMFCQILGQFTEISYVVQGHGSYLYEKGTFKFSSSI